MIHATAKMYDIRAIENLQKVLSNLCPCPNILRWECICLMGENLKVVLAKFSNLNQAILLHDTTYIYTLTLANARGKNSAKVLFS